MGLENEDKEFDSLLSEKRHKEHIAILNGIKLLLSQPEKEGNKDIIDAIKKQGESIEKVATAISNQPKPEKPEKPSVTVINENKEILPLLKELKEGNALILQALMNRQLVDEFKISEDNWGRMKTIKVTYKNMNNGSR